MPSLSILSVDDVNWEKLNPARGDKSPQAGTLWGDRKAEVETAFLAKFVDGFSSPPHIHNVSYRGIVINGLIHNDDPRAAKMWMPKESYWTQPAGESHITSAKGSENIAFIEIDRGPYLVRPAKQAHDNGERPYNIHANNVIWTNYKNRDNNKIFISPLWKNSDGIVTGSLVKFKKSIRINTGKSRLVLISGKTGLIANNIELKPGSLISVNNKTKVQLNCLENVGCIIYVRSMSGFKLN